MKVLINDDIKIRINEQNHYSVLDILREVSKSPPNPHWSKLKALYPQYVGIENPRIFVGEKCPKDGIYISTNKEDRITYGPTVSSKGRKGNKTPFITTQYMAWFLDILPEIIGSKYCRSTAEAIAIHAGYKGVVPGFYTTIKDIESFDEREVSFKLAILLNAKAQVLCNTGVIDLVTEDCIIELKFTKKHWKNALGQILVYSLEYPSYKKEIWLLGSSEQIIDKSSAFYNTKVRWFDSIHDMLKCTVNRRSL